MGDEEFTAAWEAGHDLSFDQVVAEASAVRLQAIGPAQNR